MEKVAYGWGRLGCGIDHLIGVLGAGVGGGIGLLVGLEEGEIIERDVDLPLSFVCCAWRRQQRRESRQLQSQQRS